MSFGMSPFGGNGFGNTGGGLGPSGDGLQSPRKKAPLPQDGNNPAEQREAQLAKLRGENYSHIMAHEQAHASAAGSLGGGIHIVYDGNGIPVSGFVPIRIPGLNPNNPSESLALARQVYSAATAPGGDMSGADASIANTALGIIGRAQVLISQAKQQKQP